jgi:hypothetical protein
VKLFPVVVMALAVLAITTIIFAVLSGRVDMEISYDIQGCFDKGGLWSKGVCYTDNP